MPLALTQSQFDALRSGKPVRARSRIQHQLGQMNSLETRYSEHLANLKLAGQITDYRFEALKLRLAKNTFLTVDFLVLGLDGEIELQDVKGSRAVKNKLGQKIGTVAFCEDDAAVKIKVAARMYPWFSFVLIHRDSNGSWARREI